MQRMQVPSLGWEDPLEKEMATHSSILAWRIPWTEEPGRLQSMGHKELDTTEQLTLIINLKLQHFGHLMQTANSLTLMLGKMRAEGEVGSRG